MTYVDIPIFVSVSAFALLFIFDKIPRIEVSIAIMVDPSALFVIGGPLSCVTSSGVKMVRALSMFLPGYSFPVINIAIFVKKFSFSAHLIIQPKTIVMVSSRVLVRAFPTFLPLAELAFVLIPIE
jgi:hypothetical protein